MPAHPGTWARRQAFGINLRVVRSGVTPGDLRQVPTANFVVRYAAKQTGGELNGLVACELSPRTHGVDQWWVLLQ